MTDPDACNVIALRGRPQPVYEAYADARMHEQCPNCGAAPGDYCLHPDGLSATDPLRRTSLPQLARDRSWSLFRGVQISNSRRANFLCRDDVIRPRRPYRLKCTTRGTALQRKLRM